jgi:hypothetical protein
MIRLWSVLMHPDRSAIIRRSKHLKAVLVARGLPGRLASLRAMQYRELMWRDYVRS